MNSGQTDKQTDGRTDGRTNGRADERTDGQTDTLFSSASGQHNKFTQDIYIQ